MKYIDIYLFAYILFAFVIVVIAVILGIDSPEWLTSFWCIGLLPVLIIKTLFRKTRLFKYLDRDRLKQRTKEEHKKEFRRMSLKKLLR